MTANPGEVAWEQVGYECYIQSQYDMRQRVAFGVYQQVEDEVSAQVWDTVWDESESPAKFHTGDQLREELKHDQASR